MKKFFFAVIALCLIATGAQSYWQSRQQSSVGGGGAAPTPSYVGNTSPSHSGAVWTKAGVAIGNPAYIGTRRVIWVVSDNLSNRTVVTTAGATTIGGIDATVDLLQSSGTNAGCIMLSAVVPTGTTANLQLTMSGNVFSDGNWGIYIVDNSLLSSTTPNTGSAFLNSGVTSLATSSFTAATGGFAIGATAASSGSTPAITGWTVDGNTFGQINGSNFAPSIGSQTMTGTWTGSPTNNAVCAAAWR